MKTTFSVYRIVCWPVRELSKRRTVGDRHTAACFEACAARKSRDQFLRDLGRRAIPISRILCETALYHRIERSNLNRLSRQMVLAVQQRREHLVRCLTAKRPFANQSLDGHHSDSEDVR